MRKKQICRGCIYILGLLVLALGITLNTKTNLGVSPLISVPYSVAYICDSNFGNMTFLWYGVFVLVEVICHIATKRYRSIPADLLQLPLSMVFTRFMNLFSDLIPVMTGNLIPRIVLLLVAITLTGLGIVFTLVVRLIPNPGDGIVQALADCSGKKVSMVKNCLDGFCVVLTIIISMIFAGKVVGIGIGTILAVIGTGRVVAVFNKLWKEKLSAACGVEQK